MFIFFNVSAELNPEAVDLNKISESNKITTPQRRTLRQQESYERVVRYLEEQQHSVLEVSSPASENLKRNFTVVPSQQKQQHRSSLRSTNNDSNTFPSEKKTVRCRRLREKFFILGTIVTRHRFWPHLMHFGNVGASLLNKGVKFYN